MAAGLQPAGFSKPHLIRIQHAFKKISLILFSRFGSPLQTDLQPTIELTSPVRPASPSSDGQGDAIIELRSLAATKKISKQFDESTRQLLQHRLLVAAMLALCTLITLKIASVAFGGAVFNDLLLRMPTSIVLVIVVILLYRTPKASFGVLRWLEFFGGLILAADCIWVLVTETLKRIDSGTTETLPAVFMAISFVIAIFIAIYGMFIPSDWRRTAAVTCVYALLPTAAAIVLQHYYHNVIALEDFPGFIAPILTLMMALVATQASHVVHQIRREVETAKQYGQYQLIHEIGQGGMGVVYKAKHRMLKRPAAVKLIRSEFANQPATIAAFEQEVQLSAQLSHYNSVQIYDYGRTEDGSFFYVMEYLEGETLHDRIERSGKLTNQETVDIISQVCDGLREAHEKGMVHRDLKPANIFLSQNSGQSDVVKILDFGLAAMMFDTARLQQVTGTPSYISPEQIQSDRVDGRCDIYAIGCVIYECLAGRRLVDGDPLVKLLSRHLNDAPSLDQLPKTAARFREIIIRCIEKDPDLRFPHVAALKSELQNALSDETTHP